MSDEIDWGWVRDQLEATGESDTVIAAVRSLLETYENLEVPGNTVSAIFQYAEDLAAGHAIVPDAPDETWEPGTPGDFVIGDEVRTKRDAFEGKVGAIHNGRRGKVIAIRYGDIIVNSTDNREPKLEGVHYTPFNLERRVS